MKTLKHTTDLDEIFRVMDAWENDLQRYERIHSIQESCMNAKTRDDLECIITEHLDFVAINPDAQKAISNAYQRIATKEIALRKSTPLTEQN